MPTTETAGFERRVRREAFVDALVAVGIVALIVGFAGKTAMERVNMLVFAPLLGLATYALRVPAHRRRIRAREDRS